MTRGRGQPPKIEPARYEELLSLLRSGLSMPAAARRMGVARATLYNLADRVPAMGAAMADARASARQDKQEKHEPSESCYVNQGCRRPECTAAASEARARRRSARPAAVQGLPAPVRVSVYELLAEPQRLADTA